MTGNVRNRTKAVYKSWNVGSSPHGNLTLGQRIFQCWANVGCQRWAYVNMLVGSTLAQPRSANTAFVGEWLAVDYYPTCIQTTPDNRRPIRRCGTVRDIRLWLEGVQEPINPPSNWNGTVFLHCCFGNQISPFSCLRAACTKKG